MTDDEDDEQESREQLIEHFFDKLVEGHRRSAGGAAQPVDAIRPGVDRACS